jgi:hypothetical protein
VVATVSRFRSRKRGYFSVSGFSSDVLHQLVVSGLAVSYDGGDLGLEMSSSSSLLEKSYAPTL